MVSSTLERSLDGGMRRPDRRRHVLDDVPLVA
jgi:hypothetical protein